MTHDPTNPAPPVLPVPLMPGNGITDDMATQRSTPPAARSVPQCYPSPMQANVPAFDEAAPQPFIEPNPREGVDLAWRPNGYGHHYHAAARTDCVVVVEDRWMSAFAIVRGPERGASAVRATLADAKAWAADKARELGALS